MAKLVVLSEGLTGLSHELKVDTTTIGRVDDNTFQIAQPSVSSHHCEVLMRGGDVVVKDLNSTNGTFINNQQITGEGVLKPGQVLRLGEVEIRLDGVSSGATAAAPAPAPAPKPPGAPNSTTTLVSPTKGVSLEQLEQGPQGGFDTSKGGFTKKKNATNVYFMVGIAVFAVVMVGLFLWIMNLIKSQGH